MSPMNRTIGQYYMNGASERFYRHSVFTPNILSIETLTQSTLVKVRI